MRLRNIPGADEAVQNSPYVIHEPEKMKGNMREIFGNENPIHIEIGMGKGQFLTEMARRNPQINYIGIELYSSVLFRALQKMDAMNETQSAPHNLRFLCIDARKLGDVFSSQEIDKIYLNFSDPWPKDRHAKRRLPSKEFLKLYDSFLKKDVTVEFKTDNRGLFDFALEELPKAGWQAKAVTYDLHHDPVLCAGNVMTEYEEKFSAKGNPIYKYIIER